MNKIETKSSVEIGCESKIERIERKRSQYSVVLHSVAEKSISISISTSVSTVVCYAALTDMLLQLSSLFL
jgi:hypothetical protein